MPNTLPLDILVPQAAADARLRARAAQIALERALEVVKGLGHDHSRKHVRVSDAGRCSRELYAYLHDEFDLPDDGSNILAKMDLGTLFGFWIAALEAAAIEEHCSSKSMGLGTVSFAFEQPIAYRGVVPGHIDLGVSLNGKPWWLIENKSTYGSMPISPPDGHAPQQILQAGTYAVEGGYPAFSILTIGPAVQAKWDKETKQRIEFPKLVQFDYATEAHAQAAAAEMNRLVSIQDADEPPAPDILATWRKRKDGKVIESWRCKYCRFSRCERNQNPLRFLAD